MTPTEGRVIVPLITPLDASGKIDENGLRRCVRRLVDFGVKSIFVLGSSAEYVAFEEEVRRRIIETVLESVERNTEVLVGITDLSLSRVMRRLQDYKAYEVGGFVLSPPFYFSSNQTDFVDYFDRVVPKANSPVLIYNIAQMPLLPTALETIVKRHPNIVGIKDSTSDLMRVQETIVRCKAVNPEIKIYQGTEDLIIPTMLSGGDGAVPGLANVNPTLFRGICEPFSQLDSEKLSSFQSRIHEMSLLYRLPGSAVGGIKRALALMGVIENDSVSPPLVIPPRSSNAQVEQLLAKISKELSI